MISPVHYEAQARVATLTLDAPDTRNALSTDLVAALRRGLTQAGDDPSPAGSSAPVAT
jgi:enoyl-CoA hydratase/carnithine racemase